MKYVSAVFFFFICLNLKAQNEDSLEYWRKSIELDEFMVTAPRSSFDIDFFIKLMLKDSSLLKAFQELKFNNHNAYHHCTLHDKKWIKKEELEGRTNHQFNYGCGDTKWLDLHTSKNYYKDKREPRSFTAKMYEKVFVRIGRFCSELINQKSNNKQLYYSELKNFVFRPGHNSNIPFIGRKLAVFSNEMRNAYHFKLGRKEENGTFSYVFEVTEKEKYFFTQTVIKKMVTVFDASTLEVKSRTLNAAYSNSLYSFDVNMRLELKEINGSYLPSRVSYRGWYDVAFKPTERATFEVKYFYQ